MNDESDYREWLADRRRPAGAGDDFTGAVMAAAREHVRTRRMSLRPVATWAGGLLRGPVTKWAVAAGVVAASLVRVVLSMVVSVQ